MISFFANRNGSGEIRGRQIAAYLGARLNPTEDYENDVCIWVKRQPPDGYPKQTYLDIVDASERVSWLKQHPDVGVIASSLSGQEYLERVLERDVLFIPQHHANIMRTRKRDSATPPRLGVVGGAASMPDCLAGALGITRYDCRTRAQVVAAYEHIDIQIVWRGIDRPLKNPLKIINAASFGIPTIAIPEVGFSEIDRFYWKASRMSELVSQIEVLTERGWDSERLITMSEAYHIDSIAKLYEEAFA